MGKEGETTANGTAHAQPKQITYEELKAHNTRKDQWLMINGKAYDVTEFAKRHPGGAKILNHFAGEDATDAWVAFHNDKEKVSKYLKPLYKGDVKDPPSSEIQEDFRKLRQLAIDKGWFKPNVPFFVFHFGHIIALEALAYWLLCYYGAGWWQTTLAIFIMATSQAQAGWTQHDYGHHSVFPDMKRSHLFHRITIGFIKGVSSHWWNFRHFQHHAKPNMLKKDPDIELSYFFVIGDKQPIEFGQKKKGFMPYNWQHIYFFFLGPPLLIPVYLHLEIIYFFIRRRALVDLAFALAGLARIYFLFGPFYGGWGTFAFFMAIRCVESHWFTWCTQMSHLPQQVDRDTHELDWFTMQLRSTCNVQGGYFNDWFTGHLNYQIEHHLFPTMPRSSFHKVQPLVKSLCKKHGIEYLDKPLFTAFADIIRMLKKSGKLWHDAYHGKITTVEERKETGDFQK